MNKRILSIFQTPFYGVVTFLFLVLSSSVLAQTSGELAWDPAVDNSYTGGAGNWNTTSNYWWNGVTNVVWVQGTNAYLGGSGGAITVTNIAGIIVSNLTAAQGVGNYTIGSTLANQAITVLNGAVWNVGSVSTTAHLFFSQTCVMNMVPGSVLTMTGLGLTQFGAARTAEWNVGGSTLNVMSGTVEGSAMDIGDFTSIWITNGATFESIRNASQTYTNNFVLTGGLATILSGIANAHNLTLTGVISGPGSVYFQASGSDFYALNNTNTYTGETYVGGIVDMTTAGQIGGGGVTLDPSSIWSVTQTSIGSTLFAASLTNVSGNVTNNIILNGDPTQPVIYATNLSPGSAVCTINVSGSGLSAGQYPLIKYQSQDGTLTSGSYVIGTQIPGFVNTISNNTANSSVDLVLTVVPITWTAAVNDQWDTVTINWEFSNLTPTAYNGSYTTIFNDSAASHTVDVVASIAVNNEMEVSNATPYVFQNGGGSIGGSGGLLKIGSGSITMGSSNVYTGSTVISNGVYVVNSANAIPFGSGKGNTEVVGTLDMNGFDTSLNGLNGSGIVTNTAASGTNVLQMYGGTTTFNGQIQDNPSGAAISFYETNANLTFAASQHYRGITWAQDGSLNLFGGVTNDLPSTTLLYMSTPGSLPSAVWLSGYDQTVGGLISYGNATSGATGLHGIDNLSPTNCTLTINVAAGQSWQYHIELGRGINVIAPAGVTAGTNNFNLVKDGPGTQTIDSSYYTGPTTIKEGTLVFYTGSGSLLPTAVTNTVTVESGGTLAGNGVQIAGPVTVQSGGELWVGLDALGTNEIYNLAIFNSLDLAGGSTTVMDLDNDTPTNDEVTGLTSAAYGGNLIVTNIGATALTSGETFQLFQNSGASAGNFSSITILPATGLYGSFAPSTGILTITTTPPPPTIMGSVSGGQINVSWPANYLGWNLQMQTNLLNPNWITVPNSSLVTSTNFPILNGNQAVFFRMAH